MSTVASNRRRFTRSNALGPVPRRAMPGPCSEVTARECLDLFAPACGPAADQVLEPGGVPVLDAAGDGVGVVLERERRGPGDLRRITSRVLGHRAELGRLLGQLPGATAAVPP